MKKITMCPCCLHKKFLQVEKIKSQAFNFNIYKCVYCGLHFQQPMPDKKALTKLYEKIYNKEYKLEFAEKAFSEYNPAQEHKRVKAIFKYKQSGHVLDIGASTGFFLHTLLQYKGWSGMGVEYSKTAVGKKVEGIKILHGDIFHKDILNNSFDVITMHSVFEHISSPFATLREIHKKLKSSGIVRFNVPNVNALEYKEYKFLHKPFAGFIFEHLYYYSPKNITLLLGRSGFKVIEISSRHHSTLRLPPRRPLIGWFTFPQKLFLEYTNIGGRLNLGNVIVVVAKKI